MKKILLSITTLLALSCVGVNPVLSLKTKYKNIEKNNKTIKNVLLPGEALNFDGVNDYVTTSGYSAFTEYTIEAWVKLNNLNDQSIIVGTNNSGPLTSISHNLRLVNGKFVHALYDGAGKNLASTATVFTEVWNHVAISAKNNGTMKITVNGVETVSSFIIGTSWTGIDQFRLGSNATSLGSFNGELDEVRIWDRQLCAGEILNNINGEIATTASGLIANFHFNQGVAGATNTGINSLIDASGFNHNGTLTNFALTGLTSNWVDLSSITSGLTVSPFTAPTITLTSPSNTVCVDSPIILTASGTGSYVWFNGVTTYTCAVIPTSAMSNTYSVYGVQNGCPSAVSTITLNSIDKPYLDVTEGYICSGNSFTIAPTTGAGGPVTSYTYSTGSSIVTPTTTTIFTVSSSNADGCVNTATSTIYVQTCGQSGSSLSFDGLNDVVNTPLGFNTTTYQNWTYECWAKSPASPSINMGHDGPMYGTNMGIVWNHANSNFIGGATVQSSNSTFYSASYGTLLANTWYHLAATYDGTVLKAYKNGVLTGSVTTTGGLATVTGSLSFGRHPSLSQFWEGTMDEARVWTVTRTCSEINQFMNVELTGNEVGLKAYYNFNEGIAVETNTTITTVLDKTSNTYNASLSNFALTGNNSNYFLGAPFDIVANSLCTSTSINQTKHNTTIFTIYPNPTSSILNIEVKEQTQITIVNILGDIVLKQTINGLSNINVSNLNAGVYFIQDAKSGQAIKFIKE